MVFAGPQFVSVIYFALIAYLALNIKYITIISKNCFCGKCRNCVVFRYLMVWMEFFRIIFKGKCCGGIVLRKAKEQKINTIIQCVISYG